MSAQVAIIDGPLLETAGAWSVAEAGAIVTFAGVVRPTEDGRPLLALDYEAYEPMATKTLQRIAAKHMDRFGLLGMSVEHSRGRVAVGACSFRLRVAARHRKEALDAMDTFIDELKRDAPIWKRPVFADATSTAETSS